MTEKTFGDGIKVCTEAELDEEFEAVEIKDKGKCTPERAREILGEDVFDAEQIEKTFGFAVEKSEIPEIPYSEADLVKAKERGEMLVLRVGKDAEGKAMTMARMNEIMAGRMSPADGKLLYSQKKAGEFELADDCWYKDEVFFASEPLKTEWELVSKDFMVGSTDKNYIEQTKLLREDMRRVGALTQEEALDCTDKELDDLQDLLTVDLDANWQAVAKRLSEMLVNKKYRQSAVETLFDWIVRFKNSGQRGVLQLNYNWSNSRSSDGALVRVGSVAPSGAYVRRWNPGGHDTGLGVCSSR